MKTAFVIRIGALAIVWAIGYGQALAQELSFRARNTNLLNLYIPPHNRPVEVFFPISGMPVKPYIHLAYISVRRISTGNQTDMIHELQRKTQEAGGDAVIILNTVPYTEYINSFESVEAIHTNAMSGLVIIYPESLHVVPGRIKTWVISISDSTDRGWQVVAARSVDMTGNASEPTGQRQWYEWWYSRRLESFEEKTAYYTRDVYGRVRSVRNYAPPRRMTFAYEAPLANARLASRKLYQQGALFENHRIHYSEDKSRVAYVEIWRSYAPQKRYLEFTEFSADGRIKAFLYLLKEGNVSSQFLRVDFEEYSYEEWQAAIDEILATKVVTPR